MFDWDRFKNGEIAVNCDTQAKAEDFLKECNKQKIKWCDEEEITNASCWCWYEKDTTYYCITKNKIEYGYLGTYRGRKIEISKWGAKEMKKLTFKEVIANIKEGEVWENEIAPISFIRLRADGVLDFNENEGINLNCTYKLKRKEYTFEEAFKAYEEGKAIESFKGTSYVKHYEEEYDEKISIEEIRGKWYIND